MWTPSPTDGGGRSGCCRVVLWPAALSNGQAWGCKSHACSDCPCGEQSISPVEREREREGPGRFPGVLVRLHQEGQQCSGARSRRAGRHFVPQCVQAAPSRSGTQVGGDKLRTCASSTLWHSGMFARGGDGRMFGWAGAVRAVRLSGEDTPVGRGRGGSGEAGRRDRTGSMVTAGVGRSCTTTPPGDEPTTRGAGAGRRIGAALCRCWTGLSTRACSRAGSSSSTSRRTRTTRRPAQPAGSAVRRRQAQFPRGDEA